VDSIMDSIREQDGQTDLSDIGLRSRIGKGPCQGAFCGPRITSYMFNKGEFEPGQCMKGLRQFTRSRWIGLHPILWDRQLKQVELLEAMQCGMLELELKGEEDK
jgi:glycerol-3-phosphate dehydrogenase